MRTRLLLLALLALPGTLAAQQKSKADAEIRAQVEVWEKAIAARDTAAIRALHAADAVVMPANGKAIEGRDGIMQMWGGLVQSPGLELDLTVGKVVTSRSGDLAVETGSWTIAMDNPQPGGARIQDAGNYLVVWRKDGGKWQVVRDIWNSDRPMPGM